MIYSPNCKHLKSLTKSFAVLSFLFCLSIFNANAYSLHDAIITAHENYPGILQNYHELEQVRLGKTSALAGFLPTAEFNTQASENKYKYAIVNPIYGKYQNTKSFTVTQPLFNSGGSVAQLLAADDATAAQYEQFKAQSNGLSLNVVNAYAGFIYAKKVVEFSIKNEQVLKEHVNFAQIKFDHGELTKTDVYIAKARYAQAVASLQKSEGDLSTAKAALEQLTILPVPDKIDAIDTTDLLIPSKFEEFQDLTLRNNPSIKAGKFSKSSADKSVYVSASAILPSASAQASVNRSDAPLASNKDSETYLINVKVPIFDPQGLVGIKDSQYRAHIAKQKMDSIENNLQNELVKSWSQYKTTQAMMISNKEAIAAAEQALKGTKEEYKAGTKTTLDLLDAESNLFQVNVTLKQTERDNTVALFSILNLMGAIEGVSPEEIAVAR